MGLDLSSSKARLALGGAIMGVVAACLAVFGNPKNMAICTACFIRDIAGALKLQTVETVQYFRPEIVGIVLGAFIIALLAKEFKVTAGSAPLVRFLLGFMMMVGALVFLGCPLRMVLRLSAGDLNALVGLIGFALGVFTGTFALKRGFSLGPAHPTAAPNGYVLPASLLVLLVLSVATAGLFAVSEKGPGSLHAPVIASLVGGLVFGAVAQRCRTCFAGSIRDIILMGNFDLISIIGGIFVVMLVYNVITGNFNLSFTGQPVAHARHLWNLLGMYVVGFAAVLAGGCPLRQLIMAGQGSGDAAVTFLGLLIGAAFAHNFKLASGAAAAATADTAAVPGGPGLNGQIAVIACILVLFVIGFGMKPRESATAKAAA